MYKPWVVLQTLTCHRQLWINPFKQKEYAEHCTVEFNPTIDFSYVQQNFAWIGLSC